MPQTTTPLTTQFINHKTLNKAGGEALKNAQLLALAGFIEPAYQITNQLLGLADNQLNAWQINQKTGFVHEVRDVHQILCWLLNKPMPKIAREEAMSVGELADDTKEIWEDMLSQLMMADSMQVAPAGQEWNDNYFDKLKKMQPDENGMYKDYGLFANDLDWLMRHRLRQLFKNELDNSSFDVGMFGGFLHTKILISDNALNYDTQWLVATLAECNKKFIEQINNDVLGYMEVNIFQSMLIIDLIENNTDSAKKQLSYLLGSDDYYQDVFKLYTCPWFKPLAEQGFFADCIGIDKEMVEEYMTEFATRAETQSTNKTEQTSSEKSENMNNINYADLATVKNILRELKDDADSGKQNFARELLALPMSEVTIPDEPDSLEGTDSMIAFRFPVPKSSAKTEEDWKALWHFVHELMEKTNRYPVFVMEWGMGSMTNAEDWQDFLERGVYEDEDFEGDRIGVSAKDLAKGSESVNLSETLRAIANAYNDGEDLEEFLEYECGIEDEEKIAETIKGMQVASEGDVDCLTLAKRAFAHTLATDGKPEVSLEYLTWFLPNSNPHSKDEAYLLLLPTQNAWEVPAFIHFYGAESYGTEVLIAQLKQWHEKYGMQVHWALGTMMNLTVDRRPNSEEEALELAFTQHILAPCTYAPSGFTMSEYAMMLMESDKWFLHERP